MCMMNQMKQQNLHASFDQVGNQNDELLFFGWSANMYCSFVHDFCCHNENTMKSRNIKANGNLYKAQDAF